MSNTDKKQLLFYMHAGSGNHGCEAIAVSTLKLMDGYASLSNYDTPVIASNDVTQDDMYGLGNLVNESKCRLIEDRHIDRDLLAHVLYYGYRKITGDAESFYRYRYKDVLRSCNFKKGDVAVSIGGDNYCYPELVSELILSHNVFRRLGMKTVLMGCSVEPDTVPGLILDLNAYDKIIARESITYEGLLKGGVDKDALMLCPDPAFVLEPVKVNLPQLFNERKVIGLNVSPMAAGKEKSAGITLDNYRELINYILNNTDYGIALVPHVVWSSNDDREPLTKLYNEFAGEDKKTPVADRIALIDDMSAGELKYVIGKCEAFVGARTHSTIAAYSQAVPTLVLGYSVKSRGIARDLFGTEENYVIPVQSLEKKDDLLNKFQWIMENGSSIIKTLQDKMPDIMERAKGNVSFLDEV